MVKLERGKQVFVPGFSGITGAFDDVDLDLTTLSSAPVKFSAQLARPILEPMGDC